MSGLADLIERLEKLDGPSREMDALLEIELRRQQAYQVGLNDKQRAKWRPVGDKGEIEEGGSRYHAPDYTASLDAATALVERVLPGWSWSLIYSRRGRGHEGVVIRSVPHTVWTSTRDGKTHGATPAIALCLALLRALQQEEKR